MSEVQDHFSIMSYLGTYRRQGFSTYQAMNLAFKERWDTTLKIR